MPSCSGVSAVSHNANLQAQKRQTVRNYSNRFWNQRMTQVEIAAVQQVCDRSFFHRGNRWIDSRLVRTQKHVVPDETIEFVSERFFELLGSLMASNRQGLLALDGEILLEHDGKKFLVKNPEGPRAAGK